MLMTFVLLSVELIAEEIEDPFGRDINDLPTDELAEKIRDNVNEILLPNKKLSLIREQGNDKVKP
jgi:putative membrane protein